MSGWSWSEEDAQKLDALRRKPHKELHPLEAYWLFVKLDEALEELQRLREQVGRLQAQAEMACVEPADNCACSGCMYAREVHATPPTPAPVVAEGNQQCCEEWGLPILRANRWVHPIADGGPHVVCVSGRPPARLALTPAPEKIQIQLDDETRPVWEAAQAAKAEVESWPAWKRGEDFWRQRCVDCGDTRSDHDRRGCSVCDCEEFVAPAAVPEAVEEPCPTCNHGGSCCKGGLNECNCTGRESAPTPAAGPGDSEGARCIHGFKVCSWCSGAGARREAGRE